jgi:uncharacterized protein (DUF433 family)
MEDRILIDPNVCHGKPVVKGTRVLISNILSSLANGDSIEDILKEYPNINKEDVLAAIAFGSRLSNFESSSYDVKVS